MNSPYENISLALLAGGQSKRLGLDKTQLTRDGILFAAHLYYRLHDVFEDIFMVTKCDAKFPAFPGRIVCDQWNRQASLIAVAEAIRNSIHPWVFVLPVDTVFFKQNLMDEICAASRENVDVVFPRINGKYEPLFAIYHKNLLPDIITSIEEKSFRIHSLFEKWKTSILNFRVRDSRTMLYNLNTPGDLDFAIEKGWVDPKS